MKQDKEEVKRWKTKIKKLFDNPDIETKVVNQYCHNERCLMWKIRNMSYDIPELILIYYNLTMVVAASANNATMKREAKEQKKVDKLKETRGW